jgi:EAL domain-containing protein (putative c-di-GMP-specific phosphodiesterase class I)
LATERAPNDAADAVAAGAGIALEEVLFRAALRAAADLSTQPWLALKASPRLLVAEEDLRRLIAEQSRIVVIEVTEPSTSDLTPELRRLRSLLPDNARIALEHARMGYKTLAALVELEPDFVKLDKSAVAEIADDKARRVQLRTLVELAAEHRCSVIAAGIESPSDLRALEVLNVNLGQGFLLGRPREMIDA